MRIIAAPDSFKGSISAVEACNAIETGIRRVMPDAEIIKMPVADGGEGTVDAFASALDCRVLKADVKDPLGRNRRARYAVINQDTAVIEMAEASGLMLLEKQEQNPMVTTTYGTGQLVTDALNNGVKRIIIGLGGSATNDGGVGFAQALGISFKDSSGRELALGGGALGGLHTIDLSGMDKRILDCEVLAACDVTNVLCGRDGATYMFGRQKGADAAMLETLEHNLNHYAGIVKQVTRINPNKISGTGAAGGLTVPIAAFLKGKIVSGIDVVLDTLQFDEKIKTADWIITGEGKIDSQSVFGKVPVGVAKRAKQALVPVIVLAGTIGDVPPSIYELGITSIFSIIDKPMPLEDAMRGAEILLTDTAERVCRIMAVKE